MFLYLDIIQQSDLLVQAPKPLYKADAKPAFLDSIFRRLFLHYFSIQIPLR